ncbi:MAG TPA: hypothetical protein VGZ02_10535 [Candidatus Baltobacteraceae bacterium]|nr:hypothetical protein [Candidatus Baltobacteraceae bacterium]
MLDAKIAPLRRRCAELRKEVEFYVPPVPSRFSPAEKPKAVIDHQRAMDELSALNAARDRIDFNIRQAIERAHELQITHNAIVSKIGDIFDVYCEAS